MVYRHRIGERKMMKCGLFATIIDYKDRHNITVKMSDGSTLYKRSYTDFTRKNIDPARTIKKYISR